MKLALCAKGEGLKADFDQRFGRCPYFVIVDSETGNLLESLPNASADAAGGAGPQAVQLLAKHQVEAVVLGNVGPNAATALEAANIKVYSSFEKTVEDSIKKYTAGSLKEVTQANTEQHSGIRRT